MYRQRARTLSHHCQCATTSSLFGSCVRWSKKKQITPLLGRANVSSRDAPEKNRIRHVPFPSYLKEWESLSRNLLNQENANV